MKHNAKKLFSGLLALALCLTLLPGAAAAVETDVTAGDTEWTEGTYNVTGNVELTERVRVTGDVTLNLNADCKLTASKGIEVSFGKALTIQGSGELVVSAETGDAIGGAGKVSITGGLVTATGGEGGAGIGCNFNTGNVGTAVVFASSIRDTSKQDNWSGVIFNGREGVGSFLSLSDSLTVSLTIRDGYTLTIPSGKSLTIGDGLTLTNNGTIEVEGTLKLKENTTLTNNGTLNIDANGSMAYATTSIINGDGTFFTKNIQDYWIDVPDDWVSDGTTDLSGQIKEKVKIAMLGKAFTYDQTLWTLDVQRDPDFELGYIITFTPSDSTKWPMTKRLTVQPPAGTVIATVKKADGTVTNYTTFEDAWEAACGAPGSTLTLLKNWTTEGVEDSEGANFTLTMADGVTLTGSNAATISVYGSLTMENCTVRSAARICLYVNAYSGGSAVLRDCDFESMNSSQTISILNLSGSNLTLGGLLAPGYAYKTDTGWLASDELSTETKLSGRVEVLPIPAEVTGVTGPSSVEYGSDGTLAVSVTGAEAGGTLAYQWYNGETPIPGATGASCSLAGLSVGTHQFSCQVTWNGYQLEPRETSVTVTPKALTATAAGTVTKAYDGTTEVTDTTGLAVTLDGAPEGITATVKGARFDTADAGEGKTVTLSVELAGEGKENYTLSQAPTVKGTIEKAASSIAVNGYGPHTYTGKPIADPTADQLTLTGATYGSLVFDWYEGEWDKELSGPPTDAGTYTLEISFPGSDNWLDTACLVEDVEIGKAKEFNTEYFVFIKEGAAAPVTVDLTKLPFWPVDPGGTPAFEAELDPILRNGLTSVTADENGIVTLTPNGSGTDGRTDIVTVKVTGMGNYEDTIITIPVRHTKKTPITITAAADNAVYDGQPHQGFAGAPRAEGYDGEFTFEYSNSAYGPTDTPPSAAGSYAVSIEPKDEDKYTGHMDLSFTIEPKPLAWDASGLTAAKKHDGSTAAAQVNGELKLSGAVGSDDVTLADGYSLTAPEFSSSAAHEETVTLAVTGVSLTGADAANYALPASAPQVTAVIQAVEETPLPDSPTGEKLKLEVETGLSTVPDGLKNNENLDTPAKIETVLKEVLTTGGTAIPEANTAVYDVELMVSTDFGATWKPATALNFLDGGKLTVTLPYPAGTNSGYQFTVVHMFTIDNGEGKKAGDTETPTVENITGGIRFTVTGLSPISVGWTKPETKPVDPVKPIEPDPVEPSKPSSGGGGGGGSSTYAVTVEKSEHGKVTADRKYASRGTTVTLTVTPDSGYVLDTLTVTDSRGDVLKLTAKDGGKYTITMPSRSVTIKATFALLPPDAEQPCDGGADCPSHGFTDLGGVGTWYHEAVDYVLRHKLMNGYGGGLFGPDENLSRAQLAQVLYNHAGRPTVTGASPFTDVADGVWYAPAITWAAAQGIVGGYGNGLFGPNDNITREQLAVMLWRYAGSPAATNKELHFNDIDKASDYALEALRWAVENGILNGYGDGRLGPREQATRAQVAAMFMRYLKDMQE